MKHKIIGGPPADKRAQRFQLVQKRGDGAYDWISQHRYADAAFEAQAALLEGDRLDSVVLDLQFENEVKP